jgi:hypothetical protein
MTAITIIPNFISDDQCKTLMDFIDSNLNSFEFLTDRHIKLYGEDNYHKENSPAIDWDFLNSIKGLVESIGKKVEDAAKLQYEDDDVHLCNLWLSKHVPGAKLAFHHDIDHGLNPFIKYSLVLYLNTIEDGALKFPFRQYSYKPNGGDLVMFKSGDMLNGHQVDKISDYRYSIPMFLSDKTHALFNV